MHTKFSGTTFIHTTRALLAASMLLAAAAAPAQIQSTWLNPSDGDWQDPANWSSAAYPMNGHPGVGDTYNVLINAAGSPYTVTMPGGALDYQLNTLRLDSSDATLLISSVFTGSPGLSVTSGLFVDHGVLKLQRARIYDTAISGSFGFVEVSGGTTTIFDQVTLGVDTSIHSGSSLFVNETLWLDNSVVTLAAEDSNGASIVGTTSSSTSSGTDLNILGSGQIRMLDKSALSSWQDNQTRIGSDIHILVDTPSGYERRILGGVAILNEGRITASGNFGDIEIEADSLINTGLIESIDSGDISIRLDRNTPIATAQLGNLQTSNGGSIAIFGVIDNTGDTLSLGGSAGGDFSIIGFGSDVASYTRLQGGRVETGGGSVLKLSRAFMDGVTLAGDASGDFTVTNGLTMDGGRILLGVGDDLRFEGGQAVTGTGTIQINETVYNSPNELRLGDGDAPLIFGPDITLHSLRGMRNDVFVDGFENQGTILLEGTEFPGATKITGQMINTGLIHLASGTLRLKGNGLADPVINRGNIIAGPGSALIIREGFDNSTGEITLRSGSSLSFLGEYSGNAFGSIVNEGGSIKLLGTLDLMNQSGDITTLVSNQADVTFDNTFRNGTIVNSGPDIAGFSNGNKFEDITFGSDVTLYGLNPVGLNGNIQIAAGKTLYLGLVPDGVVGADGITLRNGTFGLPDTVINGPGEIVVVGGGSDPRHIAIERNFGTLTIGPEQVLRTDGGSLTFGAVNQGTMRVGRAMDTLRLMGRLPDSFQNEGVIEVYAGGRLLLDNNLTIDNLGTINIDEEAEVYVVGDLDLLGKTLDIGGAYGGKWFLASGSGSLGDNPGLIANGRIETSGTPLFAGRTGIDYFDYTGGLQNITLAGEIVVGALVDEFIDGTYQQVLVDDNLHIRLFDQLTLDGGVVSVAGTLDVLSNNFDLLGTGEIAFMAGTESMFNVRGTGAGGRGDLITIAPGVTVKTDTGSGEFRSFVDVVRNQGTFSADRKLLEVFMWFSDTQFLNDGGVLEARNHGHLRIGSIFGDVGALDIIDGGKVTLGGEEQNAEYYGGDYRLSDPLTLDANEELELNGIAELGSTLLIGEGAELVIHADWTNTGALNLMAGGVLSIASMPETIGTMSLDGTLLLDGPFATADLKMLPTSNAGIVVSRGAVLDNQSNTLSIGSDIREISLTGGTIQGGQINTTAGQILHVDSPYSESQLIGVTLAPAIDVTAGSHLIMDQVDWAGPLSLGENAVLEIRGDNWSNLGGVTATDGWITIAGTPSTLGDFDLTRSMLTIQNSLSSNQVLAAITGQEAQIQISYAGLVDEFQNPIDQGVIDNTGNTIITDQDTLLWSLNGGTIRGGQVQALNDEVLWVASGGGALDSVRTDLPVVIAPDALLVITGEDWENNGGVIVEDASVQLEGSPTTLGTYDLTRSNLKLRTELTTSQLVAAVSGPTGVLRVETDGVVDNVGDTITLDESNYRWFLAGGTIRGGSIEGVGDELLVVFDQSTLDGVRVDVPILMSGSLTLTGAGWENLGGITAQYAEVTLDGTPSVIGEIDLTGSQLNLHGSFSTSEIDAALTGRPYRVTVANGGELDNAGSTITLDHHETTWEIDGGGLRGGIVNAASDEVLWVRRDASIRDAQVNAPITLLPYLIYEEQLGEMVPVQIVPTTLELSDGVVASGGVIFGRDLGEGVFLRLGENQSLADFGDIVFNADSTTRNNLSVSAAIEAGSLTPELLITPDLHVRTESGGGGSIGSLSSDLTIQGTLTASGPGSEIRLIGSKINIDGGTLQSIGGGIFSFSGPIHNTGTMIFAGGTTSVSGAFEHSAGAQIMIEQGAAVVFQDAFTGSGNFSGGGIARFESDLSPGDSPGAIAFGGNVQLAETSIAMIEIGGATLGEFDHFFVEGDLSIDGTLLVSQINDFNFTFGQQFLIAQVGGQVNGNFFSLEQGDRVGVFNGIDLFIDYAGGDGNDIALYTLAKGDFDGDGRFNNADIAPFVLALTDPDEYVFRYPGLDPDIYGDFDGSGMFTNADIAGFVDALTGGGGLNAEQAVLFAQAGGSASVPEPSGLVMLGLGGLLLSRRRRAA